MRRLTQPSDVVVAMPRAAHRSAPGFIRSVQPAAVLLIVAEFILAAAPTRAGPRFNVDYPSLVQRADLSYTTPVASSEEGMPIGNGRTGSLVWTTPAALHFQVNRVDLFCMGHNSRSFPFGHTSYSSGCGYVDLSLEGYAQDCFSGRDFRQHLSVYDGLTTVAGPGVTARALAWNDGDVLAVEMDDRRERPTAVDIDLRMLRYALEYVDQENYRLLSRHATMVRTGAHTALSRLDIRDGRIVLVQEFREGTFFSSSAVAIGVVGRNTRASYENDATVRLAVEPGRGRFTALMASAVSYDPEVDVEALALHQLESAALRSFAEMLADNRRWWSGYWPKAFVHLHSADGAADDVEASYTYFLYLMASCSRGTYMPRYCGMLWGTKGDLRMWGSEYWWHNQETYYRGLEPANRPELLEPLFLTYGRNLGSFAVAARQQWGSQGIWIPETTYFDGLEDLPEGVAAEMRALYLGRKPWSSRSAEFMRFADGKSGMDSRWNWRLLPAARAVQIDGQLGPVAWTSHILSSTAKIAYVYWLHYAYSLDEAWLRTEGYPVIKGAAEFYRNYPNVYRGADGKYHIRHVNNHESDWGGSDTPEELSAMHEIFPLALRAAEILHTDAELRPLWRELLANLAPIPPAPEPAEYYDLCTVGSDDQPLRDRVLSWYRRRYPGGLQTADEMTNGSTLSRLPVAAAHLGRSDLILHLLPALVRSPRVERFEYAGRGDIEPGILRNRLGLDEGPGAIEAERLGMLAQTLHPALLQSVPPTPGADPVNYLFPAWPRTWDGQFTLAARDAFLISASFRRGRVEFVEIQSRRGGACRMKNPWDEAELSLYRNGRAAAVVAGSLLVIPTAAGETVTLVPKGDSLASETIP